MDFLFLPPLSNKPIFTLAFASKLKRKTLTSSSAAELTIANWLNIASVSGIFFEVKLLQHV